MRQFWQQKRGKTRTNRHQSTTYAAYLNWGEVEGIWTIKKRMKNTHKHTQCGLHQQTSRAYHKQLPMFPARSSYCLLFPFRNIQLCRSQTFLPQTCITFPTCHLYSCGYSLTNIAVDHRNKSKSSDIIKCQQLVSQLRIQLLTSNINRHHSNSNNKNRNMNFIKLLSLIKKDKCQLRYQTNQSS